MLPPGLIIKRTRSPLSIFSPSSGSLNSVAILTFRSSKLLPRLTDRRIRVSPDQFPDLESLSPATSRSLPRHLFHRPARLASACSVASTMCFASTSKKSRNDARFSLRPNPSVPSAYQLSRHPLRNDFRQHLHVIRSRDQTPRCAFQHCASHTALSRGLLPDAACSNGRSRLPSRYKLLVAGYAPHIRRNAVSFFQDLLRLEHLEHDRPAAE